MSAAEAAEGTVVAMAEFERGGQVLAALRGRAPMTVFAILAMLRAAGEPDLDLLAIVGVVDDLVQVGLLQRRLLRGVALYTMAEGR